MEKEATNKPENASPFAAGDCLCGIPNCAGHEAVEGKIQIKGHPLGDFELEAPVKKPE